MFKRENILKIVRLGVYLALLTPLIYIPQTIFGAVFGKMIYFQIVIELTLPFFLYLFIFHKGLRPKLDWLTKIILLFFVAFFLSSLLGVDWDRSFWGYPSRMRGIFSLLHCLALYFYIITCFKEEKDKKNLLLFVVFVGLAVAVWGIIERLNPEFSIDRVAEKGSTGHRIISTTGNPIFLAGYMIFICFLSLCYFLKYKDYTRWVGLIVCALSILIIFFTGTRGALLGLGAGVFALLFYLFILSAKKQKIIIFGVTSAIIALIIMVFVLDIGILKKNKYWDFSRITDISLTNADGSTSGRLMLWQTALTVSKEKPVLGWGLENFDYGFDRFYNPQFLRNGVNETFADRAHNWFLDWLVMGGIVGLLFYLLIFIYLGAKLFKKENCTKTNAALIGLFAGFLGHSFFAVDSPSVTLMLFFSLAVCYLIFNRNQELGNQKGWFVVLIIPVLFSVYFYNIKPLYAGIDFINFKHTNNLEEKKDFAEKFLDDKLIYIDHFRLHFANEIFFQAGESENAEYIKWGYDKAIQGMEEASKGHPDDFSYLHTLGNLYLRKGEIFSDSEYYNQAVGAYKKALELSPKRQATMFQLSTGYLFSGQTGEAVKLLEEAVFLDDKIGQSHWRLGVALLADGKKQEAYNSFKNSIKLSFFGKIENEMKRTANLCIEYEDYKCAAILYKELNANPETADFYVLLSEAYTEIGDYGGANDCMTRAVELGD